MFAPNRASCKDCERHFERVKKTQSPCLLGNECPFGKPDLFNANRQAWELYNQCSSQVIVAGMGEILGIRFDAIQFLFDIYELKDSELRRETFEKIQLIDTIRMQIKNGELREKLNKDKSKPKK